MNKIAYIRSGGQTGVDRAALDFARKHNIPIIGWCPKNGWAEDMPTAPGIRNLYPELKETPLEDVSQRTRWNARDSHATMIIIPKGMKKSEGTNLTVQSASEMKRPFIEVSGEEDIPRIISWLRLLPFEITLNVGGPRASESPEAYKITTDILESIFNAF